MGQEHNLDTTQMQVKCTIPRGATTMPAGAVTFGTTQYNSTRHTNLGYLYHVYWKYFRAYDKTNSGPVRTLGHSKFIGKQGRLLAVVSAYQTVEKRGTQGALTVASQQRSLLIQMKDEVTNPRTAFCRDLLQTLRAYQQDTGADLLIVGDFNEVFGSDSEGMSGIASSLQLVNLMSTRHPSRPPPTYTRGSACLDYALASPKVSIALRKAGYEAFDARLPSDHRGYYLDFQTDLLFGNQTQELANPQQRLLHASNIQQVTTYLNEKYELLMAHNAFVRGARLTYQGNRHKFAERLDRVVTEASLVAESRILKKKPELYFNVLPRCSYQEHSTHTTKPCLVQTSPRNLLRRLLYPWLSPRSQILADRSCACSYPRHHPLQVGPDKWLMNRYPIFVDPQRSIKMFCNILMQ
ncbi:hypothetical protein MHU86_15154 [Fragilaria crotonensis]|nr:hypothetical protein MHU86_15154 [Fragilaria crotonensis]